jgi:hypothetical protein
MVKAPVAGAVKTRLAGGIGIARATAFYRHSLSAVLARVGRGTAWRTVLAVAPDSAVADRFWPAHLARVGQGGGDLGQRMQRLIDSLPRGPVVIVGSDVPAISLGDIAAAFRALGRHDAVVGPSPDGGYWLVGLKRFPRVPRAFSGVHWSSPSALEDTIRNLRPLSIGRVATLDDVDTPDDLGRAAGAVGRRVLPGRRC